MVAFNNKLIKSLNREQMYTMATWNMTHRPFFTLYWIFIFEANYMGIFSPNKILWHWKIYLPQIQYRMLRFYYVISTIRTMLCIKPKLLSWCFFFVYSFWVKILKNIEQKSVFSMLSNVFCFLPFQLVLFLLYFSKNFAL